MKKSLLLFIITCLCASAHVVRAQGQFTVAALNVDGMPKSVKILGVADLNLNPDAKEAAGATAIGRKLVNMGYDIVALEENFNYNQEIMNEVGSTFSEGTHRGGIELTAASYGNFIIQATIFNTDGLNILCRQGVASFANESWTGWNDKSGYTDNGADRLIDKGYRYYTVTVHDSVELDVYIVHMDAECTDADELARESNIRQVTSAVLASDNKRPVIILGDWNCRYNRDRLKECCIDALNADPRFSAIDVWVEHERDSVYNEFVGLADASASLTVGDLGYQKGEVVDKIIYINNTHAPYFISADYYLQDISFVNEAGEPLADHWPVVTTFSYVKKQIPGSDVLTNPAAVAWQGEDPRQGGSYYIFHPGTGKFLDINASTLLLRDRPTFLWTLTPVSTQGDIATMQMQGSGYWFNLAKDGLSTKPNLSTGAQTTQVSPSATNTQYPAYKIHRTASPARYLNCNGTTFSGAEHIGEQNDWVFISYEQYSAACPGLSYSDPSDWLMTRHPNPADSGTPTALQPATQPHPAATKILHRGRLTLRHGASTYDLHGHTY